jgi:hypothetical protein
VAGRLEGDPRQGLETHLRECATCPEIVSTWREIVASMRRGAEDLRSPHPDEMTLRDYAAGGEASRDRSVARHVARCASCELEVGAWKARQAGLRPEARPASGRLPVRARPASARMAAGALAVGVIAGAGLALVLLRPAAPGGAPIGLQPPSSGPIATGPAGSSPEVTAPEPVPPAPPDGPLQLLVLSGALRGGERVPGFRIGPGQPSVLIAVPLELPARAADDDIYLFEIRRAGGEAVWSSELTVAGIRPHLQSAEVITFAVPTDRLPAGRYEMRAIAGGGSGAGLMLRLPFDILAS